MITEIVFTGEPGSYRGSNGYGKCTGIDLTALPGKDITIWARNSKGASESCWLAIPWDQVYKLIEALTRLQGYEPIPGAALSREDLKSVFRRYGVPEQEIEEKADAVTREQMELLAYRVGEAWYESDLFMDSLADAMESEGLVG